MYREYYKKIYISRSKEQKRKIINELEVIEIVKKYGFKVICFEEYSFEDQIKMALRAKFMISNHGGGLTNLLFMASGGAVLELRKYGDSNNNCFFTLASALDINYFYQLCETDQNDINNTSDLKIDCQLLSSNIIDMLNFAGN
ncbi:MAG: glycosyltransferase family 61 protein [Pseudanabaena sp.]